ncbi:monovalent cation/H(+) antiporter subunit G [Nocardioides dongxiaopingii]|uniref:monovalent cation/H(+) antiporter subunit G n=1 Tax=Nocardioides sp. S-1144 TaxID=2582905 RepID=UPI00110DFD29|nr:monovalent cation/H(+) antiporter subunit G [Nocardioides sp. S-1144]QCW49995.1 monovalent cation/H(+) antiporter subunit G [Nocardioides sp. S-1144]
MNEVLDVVGAVCLLVGSLLGLVAAIGVLRLPDLLTRMHAATKPQVLGLMLVGLGLSLVLRSPSAAALAAVVVLAQMVTAPVAAHMVGRASYRAGQVRDDLLVVDELTGEIDPDLGRRPGPSPLEADPPR